MKAFFSLSVLLVTSQFAAAQVAPAIQCVSRVRYQGADGITHLLKGPSVLGAYTSNNPIAGTFPGYAMKFFALAADDGRHFDLEVRYSTLSQIRGTVANGETIDVINSGDTDPSIPGCHIDLFAVVCAETLQTAEKQIARYGVFASPETGTLPQGCAVAN